MAPANQMLTTHKIFPILAMYFLGKCHDKDLRMNGDEIVELAFLPGLKSSFRRPKHLEHRFKSDP